MKLNTLVLSLALSALPIAAAAGESTNATIRVVPTALDLGERAPAEVVATEVWVVNTTGATLNVERVKGSCGCLKVREFEAGPLAAGHAMPIALEVRSPATIGSAKETSFIVIPSEGEPVKVPLSFSVADVPVSKNAVSPSTAIALAELNSISVAVGESVESAAWIVNTGEEPLRIVDVKAGCGCTTFEGDTAFDLKPGEARSVAFKVDAAKQPTETKEKHIRFVTTDGLVQASFDLTTRAAEVAAR